MKRFAGTFHWAQTSYLWRVWFVAYCQNKLPIGLVEPYWILYKTVIEIMKKVFDGEADMSAMTEMICIFLKYKFARINFFFQS